MRERTLWPWQQDDDARFCFWRLLVRLLRFAR